MAKSAAYEIELSGEERAELEHRAACVLAKLTEREPRLALAA